MEETFHSNILQSVENYNYPNPITNAFKIGIGFGKTFLKSWWTAVQFPCDIFGLPAEEIFCNSGPLKSDHRRPAGQTCPGWPTGQGEKAADSEASPA